MAKRSDPRDVCVAWGQGAKQHTELAANTEERSGRMDVSKGFRCRDADRGRLEDPLLERAVDRADWGLRVVS